MTHVTEATHATGATHPTEATKATEATDQAPVSEIRILKGNPTDAEIAALVSVLAGASGGSADPGPTERNLWGHPVDKLRYPFTSWQRVTLMERTHLRR
jgi:hypothetical protein